MLKSIEIDNFLTIKHAVIEPSDNITAITGESGSGKSLILKAVEAVFLPKTPTGYIGNFSNDASVKLQFLLDENQKKVFEEYGIFDDEVVIQKIIKQTSSKALINHEPVSMRVMAVFKPFLVGIASQGYAYELFDSDRLIEIIDRFIDKNIKDEFLRQYRDYTEIKRAIDETEEALDKINQKRPLVMIEAIDKVKPEKGEYTGLLDKLKKAKELKKSKEIAYRLIDILFDGDNSVVNRLDEAVGLLEKLSNGGFDIKIDGVNTAKEMIEQLKVEIENVLEVSFSFEEIDRLNARLFELEKLQRFFGMELDEVVDERKKLDELVKKQDKLKFKLRELKEELDKKGNLLKNAQKNLSQARKEAAEKIKNEIVKYLGELQLKSSRVEFNFSEKKVDKSGADRVEILFSANFDYDVQPIHKIASGGEKNRFILALKKALSKLNMKSETLFFDEIESGISGRVLEKLLNSLKDFSKTNQIVLITHAQEVEKIADRIYGVEKIVEEGKTVSVVKRLK
ncbi:AAA family ATPase [Hippea jasoniae]|uniref:AAA family ATPase n=1 Tax=Hippea jasoniae TaxID=944479 RepID=UPI000551C593|nr:AAA family ATPase [Hippea jasoniae]